jgi:hypothetical protein
MASNETSKYKLSVVEGTELKLSLNGAQGPIGPANTLSIGTVTTAETGVSAAASITGSSPTQTLNLTLPRGNTGATGPANVLSVASTTTSAAGTNALVTISGTSPSQSLSFSIPRGNTGATGTAATISVGTTTTGAAGGSATVTNSGTSGAAVFDFTIPRGDTGEKGDKGDTGEAATITLGTVSTGAAGSSVIITNSGDSADAVFNFTIPRGDTGAQPSLTIVDNSNTSITLSDSDNNTVVRCTASSAVTITVPSTLSSGFNCMVIQAGTGTVTFAAGSGATINSFAGLLATAGRHASASLIRVASATYNLSGNLL